MSGSFLNGDPAEDDGPEDKTADDLFQELADAESSLGTSADGDEIYEKLSNDSPEEIIAAADEDVKEHPIDDAILPDEDALGELLLSDRTEEDGFLWIDTGGDDESTDDDPFEGGVVDEWADAFAAASDETLSDGEPPGEPRDEPAADDEETDESDDTEPKISIEVPDPGEVDGALVDDETETEPEAETETETETESADGWDPQSDATALDATPEVDASFEEVGENSDDGGTTGEETDPEPTDGAEAGDATTDDDAGARIFDVEPDDEALASTVDESGGEGDGDWASPAESGDDTGSEDEASNESGESSPGLVARLLSLLPF